MAVRTAPLRVRVKNVNYGSAHLSGTQLVRAGGMCAVDYQQLSALYFEESVTEAQREALMKLMASDPRDQSSF